MLVLAVMGCGHAYAQCAPSASQAGQPTICSGTQVGGYTIATDQSPVTVTAGSSIQNSGDALTVSIPANSYIDYRSTAITVNGSISSSGGNGILLSTGAPYQPYPDFTGTSAIIVVAAGGSVSGATGITLASYPSYYSTYAQASATLDNSGSITGTAGIALATNGNGNFSTITNEATGSLGAVAASFGALVNHGTIDGGVLSAVSNPASNFPSIANDGTIQAEGIAATVALNSFNFTNSGTIGNSGGGAAINVVGSFTNQAGGIVTADGSDVVTGSYLTVSNSGLITNSGNGQAVSGTTLTLTNYAGATINGGSNGIAVNGTTSLTLVNGGTINGNVLAGSAASTYQSGSVDSTAGTLNGNLTFGSGNNTLVATIVNGAAQTGITGTITGGTGPYATNTLDLTTTTNVTLSSSVTLPTNFSQVTFEPGYGTTLTLGSGFSSASTIVDNGPGTLANATTLSGTGQIVSMGYNAGIFSNAGTITTANAGGASAIALSGYAVFQNAGAVSATGDGITGFGNGIINSGTISAGGTAVSAFLDTGYQDGGFANTGTISSSGGVAVALTLSCTCFSASNIGTISGTTIGLLLADGGFSNTGTITAPGYGVALGSDATLNNLAGGIITGGTAAIGDPNGTPGSVFVNNAGTINGNVNLAGPGFLYSNSYYLNPNTFDAAPGGVLNGNLTLGAGDTLIADLVNTGNGSFGGIAGTVTASNSNLVYNVSANAAVPATTPAGFASVAYQLYNDVTLTMAAGTSSNVTLGLAGVGTVELDGTIATTNLTALQTQSPVAAVGYTTTQTALTLTNNGSISALFDNASPSSQIVVSLNGGGTLVNNGTITGSSTTGLGYDDFSTVFGASSLVNSGTIQGTGLAAVTIGNSAGNSAAAATLTNSGTITSDQNAVFVTGALAITNSGSITSSGAIGIYNPEYYSETQVTNLAGGTISGATDALLISGGTVTNAGTINGNVDLTYSIFGGQPYYPGIYYDNGGTLNGNLTLSANGALVIDLANQGVGPLGGVTGTINANGGSLIYAVNASATTSGAPGGAGFAAINYLIAKNAALTFAAGSQQTTTVALAGTGSVILNGAISTADADGLNSGSNTNALVITNNGIIATTADANSSAPVAVTLGSGDTLINNGAITLTASVVPYNNFGAVFGGLSVTNNGTISATNVNAVSIGAYYATNISLNNTGTITSNLTAVVPSGGLTITNSGTIVSTGAAAFAEPGALYYGYPVTLTNLTSGVISGAGDAIDLPNGTVVNAGTINGNVNLVPIFQPGSGSYYDQGGTLNGNLTLGYGQALIVDYGTGGTGPLGGITGTINAGNAALVYNVAANATLAASPAAASFGEVAYQLANNATLTVPGGATLTSTLGVSGQGAVILSGSLATSDQAAFQSVAPFAFGTTPATATALTIINNGSIATALDYASSSNGVTLGLSDTLINNSTISLTSTNPENYNAAVNSGQSVTNTGTISGNNANAMIVGNYNLAAGETVTNSGTITSNLLAIAEGGPATITNSGNIISTGGAAIGRFNPYGFNSGFTGSVTNLAGGTITGLGDAIEMLGGTVSNAGTINGNVNLAYSPYGYVGYSQGAYYDNGGILNGNLTLAGFQALVVDYDPTGTGPLGGVTGTINANGAALFYNVTTDVTIASSPAVAGFTAVGYQLSNNAVLTVPSGTMLSSTLDLSGQGSAILNGSIVTTDQPALQSQAPFAINATAPATTALAITNNGTIATTTDNANGYGYGYGLTTVSLGSGDTLVNNGTISGTNLTGFANSFYAVVAGGVSLTNAGTISGVGVSAVSSGYLGSAVGTLANSGTITSDQFAILVEGPTMITNSGTVTSTGGAAISSGNFYNYGSSEPAIDNLAGGVISGIGDAVDLPGGTLANAGTINGNVNLNYTPYGYPSYQPGAYFNNGGTLNGNLTLGVAQTLVTGFGTANGGSVQGITGTVAPNGATLVYVVGADASDTVTPPTGFGNVGYQLANDATLTLSPTAALTAPLGLSGTGSVVFNGTITTALLPAILSAPVYTATGFSTAPNALTITNNGTLSTTVQYDIVFGPPLQVSAVFLTSGDTLNNTGSIALTNTSGTAFATAAAVYGGAAVNNSGIITGTGTGAVAFAAPATTGGAARSLVNSGTITSDLTAVALNGAATITNSGTISGTLDAITISSASTITNSGTIASSGGTAISDPPTAAGTLVVNQAGGVITGNPDAIDLLGGTVVNAGTINGNVDLAFGATGNGVLAGGYFATGGTLDGNLTLGQGQGFVTDLANPGGGVTGTVTAGGSALVYDVYATAAATASLPTGFTALTYQLFNNPVLTLTAASNLTSSLGLAGTGAVIFDGTIASTDAVALQSQPLLTTSGASTASNALAITNNGAIAATFDAASATVAPSAILLGSADTLVNNGTIIASTSSPAPDFAVISGGQALVNSGAISGTGLSAVSLGILGSPAGAGLVLIDAGAHLDTVGGIVLSNSGTIASDEFGVVLNGPGSVTNSGTIDGAAGALVGLGATTVLNSGTIASSAGIAILSPGPGATQVINAGGGTISGATAAIDIAGGLVNNAGSITGNVNLGYSAATAPANTSPAIYLANGGTLTGNLTFSSTGGGNELIETGSGFGVSGTISGGSGTNYAGHLRNASGTVTLLGTLPSGFATEFTFAQGAGTQVTIQGPASGAANIYVGGNGTIVNQASTTGVIADLAASGESYLTSQRLQIASLTNQANVGGIAITAATLVNSGTIGSPSGTAPVIMQVASAPLSFTNSGTVNGSVAIGAANYTLIDSAGGTITGNIVIQPLRAGGSASGSITLAGGFVGSVEGGAGATTSLVVSGGSATQPIVFGSIADIASYSQGGGYAILGGTAALGAAAISGGTFVGLVGSILNAPQINVASGATFASGGTINGNLAVGGTLHVGASPDTMTVNGKVTLASGSTSIFEVSPTASAKLVVSGPVTIAANTTLQIVQLHPFAPGTSIDLIDAAGGISGDFTTLTGINGALVEKNNELSLIALFNAGLAANPQIANGTAYLNALLVSGNASPALLAALPALQPAGGAPSTQAFARLTPEAYATATQIGVENALVVSRAVRDLGWDKALHSGNLFTFGEALGNWRGLGGNRALGVSHADLSGYGFIGGLGIGNHAASLAAFGGYLDQNESITELAASTKTTGFVGGLTGRLASGPVLFDLSVIYDDSHANTSRLSPDAIALSSGYTLHGWTVDGEVSTSIALGAGWSAHPHVGATWVWTRRGGTVEDGASAFALTVAGDHDHAGFVDGGVRFASPPGAVGQLSPFLDIGVRYQIEGRATDAIAGLDGGPVALAGYGVRRRPAGATVESGVTWRATEAVSLFVNGSGEVSRGENSGSVTGGVSVRF